MTRVKKAGVITAAAAGLVALGAASPPAKAIPAKGVPAEAGAQVCPGVSAPAIGRVTPDTTMTTMFGDYASDLSQSGHWTGADGTYSAALPGHRELWVFSDTFLGTIRSNGTRSPITSDGGTTPFISNSFVEQRAGDTSYQDLTTIHGGTAASPTALLPPPDADHWYWAGDALADGGHLQAVYQEYGRFGRGAFDWKWSKNVVATYSLGNLTTPVSVRAMPSGTGVAWGVWLLRDAPYTYVYGVEDLGANKYLHVARVHGDDLAGGYQYYAGTDAAGEPSWPADESDSIRLPDPTATDGFTHVANEFSVSRAGQVYVLITQRTATSSADIDASYSCSPSGPFVDRAVVYREPQMRHGGANGQHANVFGYNAHAHPEVSDNGALLVSYNVNSLVNTNLYSDASLYRPRFIDVTFAPRLDSTRLP